MMPKLCAILLCCALWSPVVRAADWKGIARSAPPDVDMLVVVDQAANLRSGPTGAALTKLFQTILPLTTTTEAWDALARELEVPSAVAFDMLLGNRVIVLTRLRADGAIDWAFASEVEGKVAYRLLDRLGAKPKSIEFNQPVAIIENGRFQLTYEKRGHSAMLLFAPTSSEALFVDLVKGMGRGRRDSLAQSPEFQQAADGAFPDAQAFIFSRYGQDKGQWLSGSARLSGADIELNLTATCQKEELPATPFSAAQWKEFAADTLLAVVEPLSLSDLPLGWLLARFGLGAMNEMLLPIEGRGAIAIAEKKPGELALVGGLETSDVKQLAPIGDAMIAQFASRIAIANRSGDKDESFNTLAGAFPEATRKIAISAPADDGRPQPNPFGSGRLELFWSYRSLPQRSDSRGWWIVANDASAYHRAAESLAQPEAWIDGPTPISFFRAQPARLGEALKRAAVLDDSTSLSRLLNLIDVIEGRTEARDTSLRGWAKVTLRR